MGYHSFPLSEKSPSVRRYLLKVLKSCTIHDMCLWSEHATFGSPHLSFDPAPTKLTQSPKPDVSQVLRPKPPPIRPYGLCRHPCTCSDPHPTTRVTYSCCAAMNSLVKMSSCTAQPHGVTFLVIYLTRYFRRALERSTGAQAFRCQIQEEDVGHRKRVCE